MAAQLRHVQTQLEAGHEGAVRIWETIGVYLGYALAHYAGFYDLKHVLILGRVTSGRGGPLILERAKAVLAAEFPDLAGLDIRLPDEKTRRVGQSIAAASLPALRVEGERSGASSEVRAERSELGGEGAPPLQRGR
jgi:predicted NBD/HSP70 family sugar kinase